MKYHYKTPEELREHIRKRQEEPGPFSGRTFRIVLADVLILMVIMGLFYYLGYFPGTERGYRGLSFTTSVNRLAGPERDLLYLLHVTNSADEERAFPPREGKSSFRFESHSGNLVVHSFEVRPEGVAIGPGETVTMRFENTPPAGLDFDMRNYSVRLELPDATLVIRAGR